MRLFGCAYENRHGEGYVLFCGGGVDRGSEGGRKSLEREKDCEKISSRGGNSTLNKGRLGGKKDYTISREEGILKERKYR